MSDKTLIEELLQDHAAMCRMYGPGASPERTETPASRAAARIRELEADLEDAFARGASWGQTNMPKGHFVLQDSPELATLRADLAALTAKLAAADGLAMAAQHAWDQACENHDKPPPIKYMAPYGGLVDLHTALAAYTATKEDGL